MFLNAIEQHESKRKASEYLSISIDTMNKYIENLELDLGVKLLSNSGKGYNLNQTAHRIVEKSSKIKEILNEIKDIGLENKEIRGEVKVFIDLGFASHIIPQDLSELFNSFPKLSINSCTVSDPSSMIAEDIDIAITTKEINNNDVVSITSKKVYCGFFATSQYLAQHGYPVDIDDLIKNHRLIAKQDCSLKKILGKTQFEKANICFSSNNTLALINAIENHVGVGLLPLSFALLGLVCLDNIPCEHAITYNLYVNRHTKNLPRVRTLINFYKNIMEKLENPVPLLINET